MDTASSSKGESFLPENAPQRSNISSKRSIGITPQTTVCRYFNVGKGCMYGDRCRYKHVVTDVAHRQGNTTYQRRPNRHLEQSTDVCQPSSRPFQQQDNRATEEPQQSSETPEIVNPLHNLMNYPQLGSGSTPMNNPCVSPAPRSADQRSAHHSSSHGNTFNQQGNPSNRSSSPSSVSSNHGNHSNSGKRRGKENKGRKGPTTEYSLSDLLTQSTSRQPSDRSAASRSRSESLLVCEVQQLLLKFPEGRSSLLEKNASQQTYRVTVTPTDPEWSFQFNEVCLDITFQKDYPRTPCLICMQETELITENLVRHVNAALKLKIAELSQTLGPSGLLCQPFLNWFDSNIASLIQEGAGEGLSKLLVEQSSDEESSYSYSSDSEYSDSDTSDGDDTLLSTNTSAPKFGTEIKFKSINISTEVGLLQCTLLKVTLACGRCRNHNDVTLKPESVYSTSCHRCGQVFGCMYVPLSLHPDCLTLGYLETTSCSIHDVILFGSEVSIGCLSCNRTTATRGFHYGQTHTVWCCQCHQKMTLKFENCRFLEHNSSVNVIPNLASKESNMKKKKKKEDFQIKEGRPLPSKGTCEHYKKSCRWLRFPCCGKTFPCDVCHDSKEDHLYERANRMICGHCSKEQVYSADKPCVCCKSSLTGSLQTAFWEGGQGCRNKLKMSRNEGRKYKNSNKTVCKKLERVGKKTPDK